LPVCDLTNFSSERMPCILLTCGKHLHDHIIPGEGRFEPVYHFVMWHNKLSFCQVILSLCHIMLFICHHAISCRPCVIMTYIVHMSSWHMLSMYHHDICCPCVIMTYHAVYVSLYHVVHVSTWHIVHMSPWHYAVHVSLWHHAVYVWSWHAVYVWSWHIMLFVCHHDISCCTCVMTLNVVHVSPWHMLSMCHHDICCPNNMSYFPYAICCPCIIMT